MRTDYLRFDASSLQEYLRRKLIESGLYTDQIYPGSDTRILIDLFSWTFDVLTYMLNNNMSNAIFDDVEIYENLNKIIKVLSYKPRAYTTSYAEFNLSCDLKDESINTICTIPKFSSIKSGGHDSEGNSIKYSFAEDFSFQVINGKNVTKLNPILYNGEFVKYTFETTAESIPYETFIMNNISSNVDNDNLHIYIEIIDENGAQKYIEVKIVDNLIMDAGPNDLLCEARLNEDKEFVVKFGNGIHGKKLDAGTKVHAIYLESNGSGGVIDAGELSTDTITLGIRNCSSQNDLIEMCYDGLESFNLKYSTLFCKSSNPVFSINSITMTNTTNSSEVKDYESIDEIKENAPSTFRLGNRLVTTSDYRTYVLNNFSNRVSDVYVCNNNEYCINFYKWLDKYNSFNSNIRLLNYQWANACDFNNVYLWLKPIKSRNITDSDKNVILKKCNDIKDCTVNIIPCNGIEVNFMPFVQPPEGYTFDINDYNLKSSFRPPAYILIKKGKTFLSDTKIITNVSDIIIKYFENKNHFGDVINISELYQQIMSLGYIDSIKTVYNLYDEDDSNVYNISYVNGLSFAKFTPSIINSMDFEIFTQYMTLEKFQYGKLINQSNISNMIKITTENVFSIKSNEF
jgi:hypothetical protein